jgi:hypothetical protein
MFSNYATISEFGPSINESQSNIFAYCAISGLESGFAHGSVGSSSGLVGPSSMQCQIATAQVCATDYNDICRILAQNDQIGLPNTFKNKNEKLNPNPTQGDIFLRNVAAEKYLVKMSPNCRRVYQPLDPTVAGSPLISTWKYMGSNCSDSCSSVVCIPQYGVNPSTINNDPVMNEILNRPWIALDILINIYNNAKNNNSLETLSGTKLFTLFKNPTFQKYAAM